jgi:hypothetical protein
MDEKQPLSPSDIVRIPDVRVPDATVRTVAFGDALQVWLRVALLSFGGSAGQIEAGPSPSRAHSAWRRR